jgi:hypothetical protein
LSTLILSISTLILPSTSSAAAKMESTTISDKSFELGRNHFRRHRGC